MKILVTGSDGLLGSNIIDYVLQNTDIHVKIIAIDNKSRYGDVDRSYHNKDRVSYINADVKELEPFDVDVLVHCAYDIGGIKHWCDDHEDFYKRNKSLSNSMIKWIDQNNPRQVIWMSSSQVYENEVEFPSREFSMVYLPTSGYAREKYDTELDLMKSDFADRVLILRPFNCVGKEEIKTNNPNHVVPDLVKKVVESNGVNPITLYGDGSQVRHFTSVYDFASAVHRSISHQLFGIYNVCGSHKMNMQQLAFKIWTLAYDSEPKISFDYKMIDEDVRYREGDDTRFRKETNWTEHKNFNKVLEEMIWTQQMSS